MEAVRALVELKNQNLLTSENVKRVLSVDRLPMQTVILLTDLKSHHLESEADIEAAFSNREITRVTMSMGQLKANNALTPENRNVIKNIDSRGLFEPVTKALIEIAKQPNLSQQQKRELILKAVDTRYYEEIRIVMDSAGITNPNQRSVFAPTEPPKSAPAKKDDENDFNPPAPERRSSF